MDRSRAVAWPSRFICSWRCSIRRSSNDLTSHVAGRAVRRGARRAREAARRFHGRRLRGPAHLPVAGLRPDRAAASTASPASTSRARSDWKRYALGGAAVQFRRVRRRLSAAAAAGRAAAQSRRAFGAVSPDSSFNTAVSFATNTNWQGYGGETTMSYLTQMLGLAVQNFVSAASGMAVLVALIRGFARQQAGDDRQLLGRSHAHARSTSCCRCRSCSRSCSCRRASCRASHRTGPSSSSSPSRSTAGNDAPATPCRRGRQAGHEATVDRADRAARPGREPDRDQAARHERRRLLQRQLGASVREPDAALELPRGARRSC